MAWCHITFVFRRKHAHRRLLVHTDDRLASLLRISTDDSNRVNTLSLRAHELCVRVYLKTQNKFYALSKKMNPVITLFLGLAPFAVRFAAWEEGTPAIDVVLSLLPFVLVAPSSYVAGNVSEEKAEHVGRHVLYASAFCISATAVHWDFVASAWADGEEWPEYLFLYFVIGGLTLWWFVVAHLLENHVLGWLYTHQGDVVVLPFTILAFTSFANTVPDEAMRFSRSVIYFVPCIVSWATILLVAYTGFATSKTTTLTNPAYTMVTSVGFIVGITQLLLLETRAKPSLYLLTVPVVGVFAQMAYRASTPPKIRPKTTLGSSIVAAGMGTGVGALLTFRFSSRCIAVSAYVAVVCAHAIRVVAGRQWILPATLVASVNTGTVIVFLDDTHVRVGDAIAILCAYFIAFTITAVVSPVVFLDGLPTPPPPPDAEEMPQLNAGPCTLSGIARRLNRLSLCHTHRRYTADTTTWLTPFFDKVDENCPQEFVGVWWMQYNTFPMELIAVHRRKWNESGTEALFWNGNDITFDTTVSGWCMAVLSRLTFTSMKVINDRWIRTDSWKTSLRLLSTTFWLYRSDSDTMIRLVYNSRGDIIWRYNMKRIAHSPTRITRHMRHFLASAENKPYVTSLS